MSSEKEREALGDNFDEKVALKEEEEKAMVDEDFDRGLDSSKVKFVNGGAEARVDMEGKTRLEESFTGLSKEELLRYEKDPFWVRVRWILFISFWVLWFLMLVAAVLIIVVAPKCPPRPKLDWWQTGVAYQIYPRSLKDSAADSSGVAVGDLKGIKEKLSYIRHDLNATTLLLGAIYPSPNADYGYDITDYKGVDGVYGSEEDLKNLLITAHKMGMKVILDFIPNHSSSMHPWFESSINRKAEYEDYYVWDDGKNSSTGGRPTEPNNWMSVYGGSAWQWDDTRKQYYLHQLSAEQPDLNLRSEAVISELDAALTYWLELGVDGFRIDSAPLLFEAENLEDEIIVGSDPAEYDYVDHSKTTFQPSSYRLITHWRELVDSYSLDDKKKILIVESHGTANETMPFFEYEGKVGAQLPLNMNLINLKRGCYAKCVQQLVDNWMNNMDGRYWSSWVLGTHDHSRLATRLGQQYVNAANMLLFTLPGTAFTYYGEEIGMQDVEISYEDTRDPVGKNRGPENYQNYTRDPQRTPMQWSGAPSAGFTAGNSTPWLPVADDYSSRNVEAQKASGVGESNLNVYSSLTLLRMEPSFQWGGLQVAVTSDVIYSYVRVADGFPGFLVAINFGTYPGTFSPPSEMVSSKGIVRATTANFPTYNVAQDFTVGVEITLNHIHLRAGEGVVLEMIDE